MIGDSLYVKLRLLNAENPAGIQIEEDGYLEIRHFDLVKAGLEVTSLTAYLDNMDFVAKQFFLLKIFSRLQKHCHMLPRSVDNCGIVCQSVIKS
ncbi:uncharacterized protein TNCV_4404761 [Trichonephila clavipes]|uniref:Uncharacterized protein n=1 Tax=Trichonephila clavipes TaxID=2585209 RepID=A0A8X6VAV8_TRICX|nr:uncharacterized protein TNCV_4404761 [Trichonephila clavipes]